MSVFVCVCVCSNAKKAWPNEYVFYPLFVNLIR